MIGLDPVYDLLNLIIWTGTVDGERPASMILVAPAGGGKTSLLERLWCEQAPLVGDLTAREISSTLQQNPKATHILLGDMMTMLGHKNHVVKLTLRMISQLTGESLHTDSFTGGRINRSIGLITAIPPEDFIDKYIQRLITSGGFMTRFLVAKYKYKPETIRAIHEYIKTDKYTEKQDHFAAPTISDKKQKIFIPSDIAEHIQNLALILQRDAVGTRMHHHLRALVKAQAHRSGRLEVVESDLCHVVELTDFLHSGRDL